ncbi:MAG: hypothetical protein KGI27_03095 [Thaumarchaeota archaeon]|nr:hypothetical protein [Nitrososphaerota archaeon]
MKSKISDILAIVAMALLVTYIADAAVGQGKAGFLPMSAEQRGMIFGMTSIVLFFASFGTGFGQMSKLATFLLIAGGALMGTSVLGATAMGHGGLAHISASFAGIIVIGYVIMGLGIFKLIYKNRTAQKNIH